MRPAMTPRTSATAASAPSSLGHRRRAFPLHAGGDLRRGGEVGAQRDGEDLGVSGRSIASDATIIRGTGRGWISNECCTSSCSIMPNTCSAAVATSARSDGCAAEHAVGLAGAAGDRGQLPAEPLGERRPEHHGVGLLRDGGVGLRHDRDDARPGELAGGAQLSHQEGGPEQPQLAADQDDPRAGLDRALQRGDPRRRLVDDALRSEGRGDELPELGVAVGDQHRRPIVLPRPVAGPRHALDHGLQPVGDPVGLQRLEQVVGHPQLDGAMDRALLACRGHHHDGNRGQRRHLTQRLDQPDAVHHRHPQVGDDRGPAPPTRSWTGRQAHRRLPTPCSRTRASGPGAAATGSSARRRQSTRSWREASPAAPPDQAGVETETLHGYRHDCAGAAASGSPPGRPRRRTGPAYSEQTTWFRPFRLA